MAHSCRLHVALVAMSLLAQGESSDIVTKSITATGVDDTDAAMADVSLIQTSLLKPHSHPKEDTTAGETCSDLKNQGYYYTLSTQVGTPAQTFELVIDTGSNALIVPDCMCKLEGGCELQSSCFKRSDSSTFFLSTEMVHGQERHPVATLDYGNGEIQCFVGSDLVQVGKAHATMNESVFLMESRWTLNLMGPFEGIMGIGLPKAEQFPAPTFLKQAQVNRYSLCFNEEESGAFRMHIPPLVKPMGNIGHVHWGLDLQGISVGAKKTDKVLFCDPSTKKLGMQTACAAIPDSGTTLMLGPEEQVKTLFSAICDSWDRCSDMAAKLNKTSKFEVFHNVMADCKEWMSKNDTSEMDKLPPIKLHMAGSQGKKQLVEISPRSYVMLTTEPVFKIMRQEIPGMGELRFMVPSNETQLRCTPAISVMEFTTKKNGEVWILGGPLFLENIVSFDLAQNPVAMAINAGRCETCEPSLLASSDADGQRQRSLRFVSKLRWPTIDTSKPL